MATDSQWRKHVERAAVGVGERQEREVTWTFVAQSGIDAIHDIAAKVVAGNHHTLAEAGGARGVVDVHQAVARHFGVLYVIYGETVGISGSELLFERSQHISHHFLFLLLVERAVVEREGGAHHAHILEVEAFPVAFAGEEQFCLAMINDVLRIVRVEVLKNRNNYSTIGDGCQKESHPSGVVLADNGNMVAFLNADFLVEKMNFCNVACEISVSDGLFCVVISQAWAVPVVFETLLKNLDSIFFHHNSQ